MNYENFTVSPEAIQLPSFMELLISTLIMRHAIAGHAVNTSL